MRTLIVGDIHGAAAALRQCFELANVDKENDTIIFLGDIVDGWKEVKETIDEILTVKNRILILGNHDQWAIDWWDGRWPGEIWTTQGGMRTIASYGNDPTNVPQAHRDLFRNAHYWYEDEKHRLFVHGGFDPKLAIGGQPIANYLWDRSLVEHACMIKQSNQSKKYITNFNEVYVGHTSTPWLTHRFWSEGRTRRQILADEEAMKPIHACEVWMLDTGAGYEGKLTIMDIDTKEYWQSHRVADLYPGDPHGKQ